jgi:RimJ/RimL family protein N-acetyltransferase
MAGYFGTEAQKTLQRTAEDEARFIATTPGACQAGRMMGCDDPDILGWDRIGEFIARDGMCAFRLVDAGQVREIETQLARRNCRLDTWDVFIAERATALDASQTILAGGMPDGLAEREMPSDPEGELTEQVQAFMADAGLVPFSGSMLVGSVGPAATSLIGNGTGKLVATAHGYLPHNAFSRFHRYAWGGLVAVADAERGKGLGKYVNALIIKTVFDRLYASHVYELVSPGNTASRRMVEACGLHHDPAFVCGIATPVDAPRFTR